MIHKRCRLSHAACLLLLGMAALFTLSACAGQGSQSSAPPSPRPAASVAVLPGLSAADRDQDPAGYKEAAARVINVYLDDRSSGAQRHALAKQIAAMPEVVAYHYVTKREALKRFAATSKRMAEVAKNIAVNPLPPSFEILVREGVDVKSVARRFYRDPAVDSDPGTHNGVRVGAMVPVPEPSATQ